MNKLTLIQRFSLISLAAMVVFGIAFGKVLGSAIEKSMKDRAIKDTADIVYSNVVNHFMEEDLLNAKTGEQYDNFTEEIEHLSLGANIESIEIWNSDMVIVWSSERDVIGKRFPENHELKDALQGRTISEFTRSMSVIKKSYQHHDSHEDVSVNEDKHGHQNHDTHAETSEGKDNHGHHDNDAQSSEEFIRLLELYVPINFDDNEVSVVFEIYQNMEPLYHRIAHHKRIIWYWTCIGFTTLYFILFGGVWNASRRIEKQTREIRQAKQDWEETFNSITDMITVHDRDFNIISSNKAAANILGLPELDKSVKCYTYFHGTGEVPGECAGAQCVQSVSPCTVEFFEAHLNKHIEVRAIPRIDESNNMEGFIHVVRDISDRKRDEELIQTQLNRLNALRSIDKAIIGSIDIKMTLDVFLDQAINHLHIDAASVLLLNKHSHTLEYVTSSGFRSDALKYTKLKIGEGNAGRAAKERKIVSIPGLDACIDGFANSAYFEKENFRTYFGVPLIVKGQVKGVLELFHRSLINANSDWMGFMEAIADQGAIAIDNATLFDDLQGSNIELILAYDSTIEGWSKALDLRDKETEGHTQRVTEITVHIAKELDIKEESIIHYRRGALLHDIGKMGVPDNILLKPGPLTDEEWDIMRLHPVYAREMLYPIEYLRPAIDIPYYHHEKWDGTGYPKGLKGEEIPLSARIFAIVDVWDALRSDRPYRAAWPKEKVIEHIRSLSGSHFDPEVVTVFLKIVDVMEDSVVSYS